MIYDLHSHSLASDGVLPAEEVVRRAAERGIDVLSITDHDTTSGLSAAIKEAQNQGLTLIPGIEFSAQWLGRGIHIVGLNIDPKADSIEQAEQFQNEARETRAKRIAELLERQGIHGALEGAKAFAGDASAIARPHFARFMVEVGAVKDVATAFKRYLGEGKSAFVKQPWPSIEEVTGWVNDSGGVAVVAHPAKYKLTRTKLSVLLQTFKEAGGSGVEVISGKQTLNITQSMKLLAKQTDLCASIGSDFHAPGQAWQDLGCAGQLPSDCRPIWDCW